MASLSRRIFRFSSELEREFLKEYGERSVRVVQGAAVFCLAICSFFGARAYFISAHPGIPLAIYFGYQVPGLLLWVIAARRPGIAPHLHRVTFAVTLAVFGGTHLLFVSAMPQIVSYHQPASTMLVTMLFYAGLRLPFLWATALGWIFTALSLAASAHFGALRGPSLSIATIYLTATNFTGMGIAYVFEAALRRDFLARREIAAERARSEKLLLNILPAPIAERLKAGEKPIADGFEDATVLFADIVGYTELASKMSADELVTLLGDIFSRFDRLCDLRGAEKIKTIGDAYMAVGGITKPMTAQEDTMAELGVDMLDELETVNRQRGLSLKLRVGLHSGPVVAGVIGDRKFSYDLWGDAVNVASRMESHGVPGAVHLSEDVANKLSRLKPERRGTIEVKGKGQMTTFLLQH